VTQVDEGPDSSGAQDLLTFGVSRVGEVLAERYELLEHIGDDNFGRQVWRGIDVVLRRPVALVLRYPGGEAAVEMLAAAVAASRVTHPHLVDVYDAIDEGTRAYVVREWVDGGSLREYVAEAPLDPDRATTVAHAVASAVAAVHASGVTHGNIHPGTVLIGADGRVVLSDARSDESVTPDDDVRAVGAILYCALTGHWPHAEAGPASLPDAVRDPAGVLAAPRQVRGGVPGHLSDLAIELVDSAIPPPSADVLAADLGRLDTENDDQLLAGGGPLDFGQEPFRASTAPEPQRPIAKKLAVGVAGLLVLATVGLLLATQFLPKSKGSAAPSPSGTASASPPAANNDQPKQIRISASQVRGVEPKGDRTEGVPANAFDGDQNTVWKTDHYKSSPNFGNLKPGMGILIDLGSPQPVSSVEVDFATPGATVQLYTGDTDPGDSASGDRQILKTYIAVGEPSVAGPRKILNLADAHSVRYLLVWISKLPDQPDSKGYIAEISEIKVLVGS
jgi:eukaryotic-like serine/threonine-protein kinase